MNNPQLFRAVRLVVQKSSLSRRAAAFALCLSMIFSGGCQNPYKHEGYEVIGRVDLAAQPNFDFNSTLRKLYVESINIVVANTKIENTVLRIDILQSLSGTLVVGQSYTADLSGLQDNVTDLPKNGDTLLLFLEERNGVLYPLVDESSWLQVKSGVITTKSGSTFTLDEARYEISKLDRETILPPNFYYYSDMETLVQGSDYIFIGTLESVRAVSKAKFYLSAGGKRQSMSGEGQLLNISCKQIIKGDIPDGIMLIMSSPVMLENTIKATSLQSVTHSKDDAPPLEEGMQYLFFAIDAPVGSHGAPKFLVNEIQGFVPLLNDVTMPIPTNVVFTSQAWLDDIIFDILAADSGEAGNVNYDPNSLEWEN